MTHEKYWSNNNVNVQTNSIHKQLVSVMCIKIKCDLSTFHFPFHTDSSVVVSLFIFYAI